MISSSMRRREALLSLASLALAPLARGAETSATPGAQALPANSVYRLDAMLETQDGRTVPWSSLQGRPVLASMFYTSCDMVCPMIFETIHSTLRALPPGVREQTRVAMVSFDPDKDTVAVLQKTAQSRGCDEHWLLGRADAATTRKIAAVLGIQYRRLSNGEYNHSSTVDVLDAQGRIVVRSGKLGAVDPAVVAALRKT
jgi:protein SCO1/2